MRITFYGAASEVTGSCSLVEVSDFRFIVDCGMFQGHEKTESRNKIPPRLNPRQIDAVLLTHGHLDHCGRLPRLVKSGFRGPIYATQGTIDIAKIILADAAAIQKSDTDRLNRKRARAGLKALKPLFNTIDVQGVSNLFRPIGYDENLQLADDIEAKFVDAGHILGSSCIVITTTLASRQQKIVFSGDLGQYDSPLMRDPDVITDADIVIMESTYGDRDHRTLEDTVVEFQNIIKDAAARGRKILIPSFAVGRTQTILYYLAQMFRTGIVKPFPIYLDSPMAITATKTYLNHVDSMDAEISELLKSGQLKKDLSTLVMSESQEESQRLNAVSGPCIIIAGAGMCNAGRIMHHLKHSLWKDECSVIIVGYQAKGSLGRSLVEGAGKVKVLGETVSVRASVHALGGFSAHAGQSDLLRWLEPAVKPTTRVILNHGESHPINQLAIKIKSRFGIQAEIPQLADTIVL